MPGILAVGVLLRAIAYGTGRSLWIDEASLALNIGTRSYIGLLQPLDYNQAAPPGFLWAERFVVSLFGMNERALRLIPFLAAVAALFLVGRLALRLLDRPPAVLALALAAVSPALIEYAAELKPYAVDVLMCLLLTNLAADILEAAERDGAWWRLFVAGVATVLSSTAAPMMLMATIAVLLLSPQVRDNRRRMLAIGAVGVTWASMCAVMYFAFYHASDSQYLHSVWRDNFLTPGSPDLGFRAWRILREVVWWGFQGGNSEGTIPPEWDLLIDCFTLMLVGFMAMGALSIARQRGSIGVALLLAPAGAALIASAAGRYPLSLRLILFVLPGLILLGAAGVFHATVRVLRHPRSLALVPMFLLAPPTLFSITSLWAPSRLADARTVIRDLEGRRQRDEPVYVFARGLTVWAFYTTDWSRPDTARLEWFRRQGGLQGPAFENAPGRPAGFVGEEEGQELVYVNAGAHEILGLSTGTQWLALAGFSQPEPDRGWAAREFTRIREAANPTVWLFFTHVIDGGHRDLLRSLRVHRGRLLYRHLRRGAAIYHFHLTGDR